MLAAPHACHANACAVLQNSRTTCPPHPCRSPARAGTAEQLQARSGRGRTAGRAPAPCCAATGGSGGAQRAGLWLFPSSLCVNCERWVQQGALATARGSGRSDQKLLEFPQQPRKLQQRLAGATSVQKFKDELQAAPVPCMAPFHASLAVGGSWRICRSAVLLLQCAPAIQHPINRGRRPHNALELCRALGLARSLCTGPLPAV